MTARCGPGSNMRRKSLRRNAFPTSTFDYGRFADGFGLCSPGRWLPQQRRSLADMPVPSRHGGGDWSDRRELIFLALNWCGAR